MLGYLFSVNCIGRVKAFSFHVLSVLSLLLNLRLCKRVLCMLSSVLPIGPFILISLQWHMHIVVCDRKYWQNTRLLTLFTPIVLLFLIIVSHSVW